MSTSSSSAPVAGSAPLADASHEAFARAIVSGIGNLAAYRAAGYTKAGDRGASTSASRLLKKDDISARIAWLKTQAADKTVMDLREVLQELTKLGRANMLDYIEVEGGDPVLDFSGLTRDQAAAIGELTVETTLSGEGEDASETKRVRFKLHDKKGPLSELRRHYEPNKHEHTGKDGGPIETKDVSEAPPSDIELARRIAFALEKGARAIAAGTIAGQAEAAPADKPAAAKPKRKRKASNPKPAAETPAPAAEPKKDPA